MKFAKNIFGKSDRSKQFSANIHGAYLEITEMRIINQQHKECMESIKEALLSAFELCF